MTARARSPRCAALASCSCSSSGADLHSAGRRRRRLHCHSQTTGRWRATMTQSCWSVMTCFSCRCALSTFWQVSLGVLLQVAVGRCLCVVCLQFVFARVTSQWMFSQLEQVEIEMVPLRRVLARSVAQRKEREGVVGRAGARK